MNDNYEFGCMSDGDSLIRPSQEDVNSKFYRQIADFKRFKDRLTTEDILIREEMWDRMA